MPEVSMTQEQKDNFLLTLARLWAEQEGKVLTALITIDNEGRERKIK